VLFEKVVRVCLWFAGFVYASKMMVASSSLKIAAPYFALFAVKFPPCIVTVLEAPVSSFLPVLYIAPPFSAALFE